VTSFFSLDLSLLLGRAGVCFSDFDFFFALFSPVLLWLPDLPSYPYLGPPLMNHSVGGKV